MNNLRALDFRVIESQSGTLILFLSDDIKTFDSIVDLNDFICSLTKDKFE